MLLQKDQIHRGTAVAGWVATWIPYGAYVILGIIMDAFLVFTIFLISYSEQGLFLFLLSYSKCSYICVVTW